MLNVVNDQMYDETKLLASLHGKTLKAKMDFKDIDEKTDEKIDQEARDLLARAMKEYNDKKGKS